MISEALVAAIRRHEAHSGEYDHILCAPLDYRGLLHETLAFHDLTINDTCLFRGYRLQQCEAVARGTFLFHSPNKPRTFLFVP